MRNPIFKSNKENENENEEFDFSLEYESVKARTVIGAMTGLLAGLMAPQFVSWGTFPEAALSMAVTATVIPIAWAVLPKR